MLATGGVHPLALRRQRGLRTRRGAAESELMLSVFLVLLSLAGFAYGLRWIEHRYAPAPSEQPAVAPVHEVEASPSALSSAMRTVFGIKTAEAATLPRYWGAAVAKNVTIDAAPGETKTVDLQFKNLGSVAWSPQGRAYISAYTIQPRYHASVFRTDGWLDSGHPAKLASDGVAYGQVGTLHLTLKAPTAVGTYSDMFQLAAEDTSWIWGAYATVTVNVKAGAAAAPATPTTASAPVVNPNVRYLGTPTQPTISLTAAPGDRVDAALSYENLGSATWTSGGSAYASVYTVQPNYHASQLRSPQWMSSGHPAKMETPTVKPGQTGIVRFALTAPLLAGVYQEDFQLASEDTAWIKGAVTHVTLTVAAPASAQTASVVPASADATPPSLMGTLYYKSADRIEAPGGEQMTMRLIFRNDGTVAWKKQGIHVAAFDGPAGGDTDISDPSWPSPTMPVIVDRLTGPRQTTELYFTLTTPGKKGDYTLSFEFVADGLALQPPIVLPIKVISDALNVPPPVQANPETSPPSPTTEPSGEPIVRVGLYTTDHQEEIGSTGPFEARSSGGALLASFAAGSRVQFWYDLSSRVYRLMGGNANVSSASPIRFSQSGSADHFTLWSDDHQPSWDVPNGDNTFRGTIEMRKNDTNDYVWVIDELPIEQYLRGMGETSNASPIEFQKALAVAQRSYVYWHYRNSGRHETFTVDSIYDQVYLGYGAEQRMPKWAADVNATRAQVVTYNGEMVVTPYYSSSDGRTRAWTEVWGGSAKPWLVSVACPYDAAAGRQLSGHGVGMSAWDAIGRANAGASYDVILKWYYQGTGLKTAY